MTMEQIQEPMEQQIAEWRLALLKSRTVTESDADELEAHLREQTIDLEAAGLTPDESFLIAVRRLGTVDRITAEFAREHSDRLWKQLIITPAEGDKRQSMWLMLGFAVLAAVLVQVLRLAAPEHPNWVLRNAGFSILPVLAAYFVVVRRMSWKRTVALAAVVVAVAIVANVYPLESDAPVDLIALHLPVLLWFVVGAAYVGGNIRSTGRRMEFLRFTGEWAIYYALIALGGAVLMGLTMLILGPLGYGEFVVDWVLPAGIGGAAIVAAWLVEAKKSIIENLAPVLTAIFTPLFALMLVVAAGIYLVGGAWQNFDRDLLTGFDALLLVVVALVVYGISARDTLAKPGVMDVVRLCAVVAAIILDVLVLVSMFERVGEFGFTANRVAALGLNLVLLINLVGTAWLFIRALAERSMISRLERWQTGYLFVFAAWVLTMVVALPPIFGFA